MSCRSELNFMKGYPFEIFTELNHKHTKILRCKSNSRFSRILRLGKYRKYSWFARIKNGHTLSYDDDLVNLPVQSSLAFLLPHRHDRLPEAAILVALLAQSCAGDFVRVGHNRGNGLGGSARCHKFEEISRRLIVGWVGLT